MSDQNLIDVQENASPGIIKLLAMGRKKGFVTFDDILNFFPNAEQDVAQLEDAFAALLSAGISFIEDASLPGPSEDEVVDPDDFVAALEQKVGQMGADKTGGAGDHRNRGLGGSC